MKILHTSDWHLGQEFYSFDRREEHEAFFRQLREIVAGEQPDVMVVSGDIYHNATPSNAVMRMFTDQLDEVRRACPTMQVVVTAGNHDSSSRLEVTRTLWEHLGVTVIGKIRKKEEEVDFDQHIIAIDDKEGKRCGYVVALPHVFLHSFPLVGEAVSGEERPAAFLQALAERVKEVNTEQLPVVMMAHMAITGSDITGHDDYVGGMEYINVNELKVGFDYLALGHIHCPQWIGEAPARYCGTPIPVSFDEDYGHSVTVVELKERGGQLDYHTIPIENPWPLKSLPREAVTFDEALQLLKDFPKEEKAYIRLHVQLTDVPPKNAIERASLATEGKQCRFCCFKWEQAARTATAQRTFADVEQMKSQSPLDIADLYYTRKYGQPMEDDLRTMMSEVMEQLKNDGEEPLNLQRK